ncbi:MAG: HAMP domain-containing histidine kinase [Treponema sp.]|jgi:two-component system sensor histidine kinase HydH|nr:HAMP domain-containing histidine kinase [Treponema sp.]
MKRPVGISSWIAAFTVWILLSALVIFTLANFLDRARLIRDNDNEGILNTLLTISRDYDDFGLAINSSSILRERITGFAVYDTDLLALFRWGETPAVFDESLLGRETAVNRNNRFVILDRKKHSVKFVFHTGRMAPGGPSPQMIPAPQPRGPPGPPGLEPGPQATVSPGEPEENNQRRAASRQNSWGFYNSMIMGKYYYIDIAHPAYWRTQALTMVFGPLCIVVFLILVLYIRNLYIRNREYRERIEAQKNLVVLGTAASTLAHEIKNPLLSIRLQTGILDKLYSSKGREELAIINEEVDRLSALTYRVNDYLREGKGNPAPVNLYDLIADTGARLCSRDIILNSSVKDGIVFADPDRLRSVFENLIRNALESGGDPREVGVSITRSGGVLTATVYDRGNGVAEGDLGRIFDPFFTRKSAGTGIGLSICKRFTEAAGGSVTIENREGCGAEAKVILPEYTAQGTQE